MDNLDNEIFEPEAVYNLSDGTQLEVYENEMEGMAGEPVYFLVFRIGDDSPKFKDFEHLLNEQDLSDINKWQNNLGNQNHQSAIDWVY